MKRVYLAFADLQFLLKVLIIGFVYPLYSQTINLNGYVKNNENEPVVGAEVYLENEKNIEVKTDQNGFFNLPPLQQRKYKVIASFIGYQSDTIQVMPGSVNKIKFILKLNENILKGVVVTAQKRLQSIEKVPASLTAIGTGFLNREGITELDQLSEYVPGLQVQLQSPNNPGFVIRGITSDSGASNIEPRVSVFQDGVSISKSRGSVVELYDLERIEVLKGPQGTLFGRGAEIGAVHIIQKKAQNNTSSSLAAGLGDYNYRHIQGFFNTPLVKDKLLFRASGIYKYREGFIRNLSGGRLNGKDTKAARVQLRYHPSLKTDINLIYNYQYDTPPGTSFKSGTYAPAGGTTAPWTFADLDPGKDLGLNRTVWGTTLKAKHTFNPSLSLTSITAYREFDSYESFDADGTAAPALWFAEDAFGKQFSQEIRANFKINQKFEGFAGMSYFYENGFQHVPFETNEKSLAVLISPMLKKSIDQAIAPINAALKGFGVTNPMEWSPKPLLLDGKPNYVSSLSDFLTNQQNLEYLNPKGKYAQMVYGSGLLSEEQSKQVQGLYAMLKAPLKESHSESYTNYGNNRAYDFFTQGTYHITHWFNLTGGLRFTVENIESSYKAMADPEGNHGTLGFIRNSGPNDLFLPTKKITEKGTYTSMVGSIATSFNLSKHQNIYLTLSKGRRPNVIQFSPTGSGTDRHYEAEKLKAETVWNYEIGYKGFNKNHRLYHDISAFYYDYRHFQTNIIDENQQSVTVDAGAAATYGLETSFKYQLSKALNLFGNYAFIDASFDDKDSNGNKQRYAGNTFRLTPKHSFALGVNFQTPLSTSMYLFIRPSYNYKSKVYFEEDNAEELKQEGYGLMNLRAGIELPKSHVSILMFVNNLFDKKYIIDAGNTGRNFGTPTYIAGAPRLSGFQCTYRF